MNKVELIKESLNWTGTTWIVEEVDGKIFVGGFWLEKDWGEICGVESNYDMVEEAILDLEEIGFKIDDSCEASDLVHKKLKLEDDSNHMDESTGWLCAILN